MALIKCPECGTEVSDRAPACPNCGAPIAAAAEATAAGAALTTTQGTSKKLKLQSLIAGIVFAISFIVMFSATREGESATVPVIIAFGSLVWFLVTRIRIWWHHS